MFARSPRPVLAALTASVALLATACASADADSADLDDADLVVVADEMEFRGLPDQLPSGPLRIGLDNQGHATHDLTVDGAEGTIVSARGGRAAMGTVDLAPGTYTLYCAVAGHRSAGMEAQVVVR